MTKKQETEPMPPEFQPPANVEAPVPDAPPAELKESDLILEFHWKDLPIPDQRVGKALNELVEAMWAQLPARTGRRRLIEQLVQFRAEILKPSPLPLTPQEANPLQQTLVEQQQIKDSRDRSQLP
jgi:hypothetical protein